MASSGDAGAASEAPSAGVVRREVTFEKAAGGELAVPAPMPTHAVVWIDHTEARIFYVEPDTVDKTIIAAPQHRIHRHPKGHGEPRAHPADQRRFFAQIERLLTGTDHVLIVGPASAKQELVKDVHTHSRALEATIVGVEAADHPTDGEIVAHAKAYFQRSDRMTAQRR
jgi:hypothetical protein